MIFLAALAWGALWFSPAYLEFGGNHPTGEWLFFKVGAFALLGDETFASMPWRVYAENPSLQIGPPALLLTAAVTGLSSPATATLMMALVMLVVGCWLVSTAWNQARWRAGPAPAALLWLAAAAAVLALWSRDVAIWRHLDDVLAITAGCLAVRAVGQGNAVTAGMWAGFACASKPWAVLFVPVLLGLPRSARAVSALACVVAGAAWWFPFLVSAPDTLQALGAYQVVPDPGSVPHLLGVRGDSAAWLRPAQFGAATLIAGLVALRGHWHAAPLAGLAVKALFDPYFYSYYGMAPLIFALVCDARRGSRGLPLQAVAVIAAFYVAEVLLPPAGAGIVRAAWALCVVTRLLSDDPSRRRRRPSWFARSPFRGVPIGSPG